jgi:hypothetical protein
MLAFADDVMNRLLASSLACTALEGVKGIRDRV